MKKVNKVNGIVVGDKKSKYPIIQGGMGVGVSLHRLAGTVAAEGGIGVISVADIGFNEPDFEINPNAANIRALHKEVEMAREISPDGIIGVNILTASSHYDELVREAAASSADIIISGAGLPLNLPWLVKGSEIKIAPIVSSARAFSLICRNWKKKYDRLPDLVIVEGPEAGGHLGFSYDDIIGRKYTLEGIIGEVLETAVKIENEQGKKIPVIAAGGIYTKDDITRFLKLGAAGVQMASRFVVTEECDASENFKQAYINASKDDIQIIKSPVGMPGRAIRNPFILRAEQQREKIQHCTHCLKSCKFSEAPYCITEALINSVNGDTDNGLIFCGSNTDRIKEMTTVRKIINELFAAEQFSFAQKENYF